MDKDDMTADDQAAQRRRRVFYIPGYDPIHPRRYRELYRAKARSRRDFRLPKSS